MKTVILTGRLAKRFGSTFSLDVMSPAEAVRALCHMIAGFEAELRKGQYRVFKKYSDGRVRFHDEKTLNMELGTADVLQIEPVAAGKKSGWLNVILGAVLVGAAFLLTGGALAAPALSIFGTTITGTQMALVGGLMAISGVSSLLAPQPKMPTEGEEKRSAMINTPENRTGAGQPVPIVYGRSVFVGSVVVGNSVSVEEFDDGE